MPNVGSRADWVGVTIAGLMMLGGIGLTYSSLASEDAKMVTKVDAHTKLIEDLDDYQAYLSKDVDELKGDVIKLEAQMVGVVRATDKLDYTMGQVLKELKTMNENIIRMGAKQDAKE